MRLRPNWWGVQSTLLPDNKLMALAYTAILVLAPPCLVSFLSTSKVQPLCLCPLSNSMGAINQAIAVEWVSMFHCSFQGGRTMGQIGRRPVPFWDRVKKTDTCWEWTGSRNRKGYGGYWDGTKVRRAHRVAWQKTRGPIPDGMLVCHHCDNPPCVNPDHLYVGTNSDNALDRERRRRRRIPPREQHWTNRHPERVIRGARHYVAQHPEVVQGERNPSAKLKNADVVAIRRRYAAGGISLARLAKIYGVGTSTIHRVVRGKSWTHDIKEVREEC